MGASNLVSAWSERRCVAVGRRKSACGVWVRLRVGRRRRSGLDAAGRTIFTAGAAVKRALHYVTVVGWGARRRWYCTASVYRDARRPDPDRTAAGHT